MAANLKEKIWETQWAFTRTVILRSAVEVGLFDAIHRGKGTVGEIARACRSSSDGVRRILDALVAMEFLRKGNGRFQLAKDANKYLVRESSEFIGGILVRSKMMMETWADLPAVVRSGKPVRKLDVAAKGQVYYPELAAALYSATLETAARTATSLGAGRRLKDLRILDVAAGSAVWSLAFAARDRGARVTAVDFAPVLKITRKFVRANRFDRRYRFLPGDIRELNFGREEYDLAILGQICHSEGPVWTRRLLRKTSRALVRGGHLVIAEFVPNDRRTGALFPLQFSLNMFLLTRDGDTFRMADYRNWLLKAAFGPPRRIGGIRPPACVLHARKK